MNASRNSNHPATRRGASAKLSLGFAAMAMVGLAVALPDLVRGLAMTKGAFPGGQAAVARNFLVGGWVAGVLFAAGYALGPAMAAARLRYPGAGWIHLGLHAIGLVMMLPWFGGLSPEASRTGWILVSAGALIFAINLFSTAGVRNRWTPANLMYVTAWFWLVVYLSGSAYINWGGERRGLFRSETWWEWFGNHILLAGCAWQATVASIFHLANQFRPGRPGPGKLAWAGWAVTNGALAAMVMSGEEPGSLPTRLLGGLLTLGMFCLLLVMVRQGAAEGSGETIVPGIFGVGLAAVILASRYPSSCGGDFPELAILAALSVPWLGILAVLVPWQAWHVRCAPVLGAGNSPPAPESLKWDHLQPAHGAGVAAAGVISASGALSGAVAGVQVGATLLGVMAFWLVLLLWPSLKLLFFPPDWSVHRDSRNTRTS